LERITAESFKEPMATGIAKGVHKQELNPACGLFLSSQSLKGMGPQKGQTMATKEDLRKLEGQFDKMKATQTEILALLKQNRPNKESKTPCKVERPVV
jgi:hypothetical protein